MVTDRVLPDSANTVTGLSSSGPSQSGGADGDINGQASIVDSRITELEIKIAYLEDTIKQLDDEVYRQLDS